jgi:hypothetical protein
VDSLGEPEDDVSNTFTARLLLLLESYPLLGEPAYRRITSDVISAYWEDYQDHKGDFMPAFLANDVLRMWRTFCVNYEARTQREPEDERVKRRIKNYKLKHSRLLTCYSALLYLLAVFSRSHSVSPTDVESMISLTPTQRLEWMLAQSELAGAHAKIKELINGYEQFLTNIDAPLEKLLTIFADKKQSKDYMESAYKFGDSICEAMEMVGAKSRFYRVLVV